MREIRERLRRSRISFLFPPSRAAAASHPLYPWGRQTATRRCLQRPARHQRRADSKAPPRPHGHPRLQTQSSPAPARQAVIARQHPRRPTRHQQQEADPEAPPRRPRHSQCRAQPSPAPMRWAGRRPATLPPARHQRETDLGTPLRRPRHPQCRAQLSPAPMRRAGRRPATLPPARHQQEADLGTPLHRPEPSQRRANRHLARAEKGRSPSSPPQRDPRKACVSTAGGLPSRTPAGSRPEAPPKRASGRWPPCWARRRASLPKPAAKPAGPSKGARRQLFSA